MYLGINPPEDFRQAISLSFCIVMLYFHCSSKDYLFTYLAKPLRDSDGLGSRQIADDGLLNAMDRWTRVSYSLSWITRKAFRSNIDYL